MIVAAIGWATAARAQSAPVDHVSLSGHQTLTVGEAFRQIERQTGSVIAYSASQIDTDRIVTLKSAGGTVEDLLSQLLAGSGQTYETQGKYIILVPAAPAPRQVVAQSKPALAAPAAAAKSETVLPVAIPAITQRVVIEPEPQAEQRAQGGHPQTTPQAGVQPRQPQPAPRGDAAASRLMETPVFALKTNILYDMTTTINLAGELRLGRKTTFELPLSLNPWTFNKAENTKFKFFLIQPELRLWTCEAFNGSFFGLHGHWAYFNVGHLPNPPFSPTMNAYRFEGQLAGAGLSYGYQWILSPRWGLEAEIGAGYARLWYGKYPCQSCGKQLTRESKNYWGVTRAGVSLMYTF